MKGTGSPITPGTTTAPITPTPTGSVTSAPTPAGMATYKLFGAGFVSSQMLQIGIICICWHSHFPFSFLFSAWIQTRNTTVLSKGVSMLMYLHVLSFVGSLLLLIWLGSLIDLPLLLSHLVSVNSQTERSPPLPLDQTGCELTKATIGLEVGPSEDLKLLPLILLVTSFLR